MGFEPTTCGLRVRCSAIELEARSDAIRAFLTTLRAATDPCRPWCGRPHSVVLATDQVGPRVRSG